MQGEVIYGPGLRAEKGDNGFIAKAVGGLGSRPWFTGSLRSCGIKISSETNGIIWLKYRDHCASLCQETRYDLFTCTQHIFFDICPISLNL